MDLGIQLSDKAGEYSDREDLEEIKEKINEAVKEYGYVVLGYGQWDDFTEMCAAEHNLTEEFSIKHE